MTADEALRGFSEALPREQLQAEVRAGRRADGAGVYLQRGPLARLPDQCGQHPEAVLALVADPEARQALVRRLYRLIEEQQADRP